MWTNILLVISTVIAIYLSSKMLKTKQHQAVKALAVQGFSFIPIALMFIAHRIIDETFTLSFGEFILQYFFLSVIIWLWAFPSKKGFLFFSIFMKATFTVVIIIVGVITIGAYSLLVV